MKTNKYYKRFRHAGFSKVNMDFGIFAIAFNLQKLFRNTNEELKKLIMDTCQLQNGLIEAPMKPFLDFIVIVYENYATRVKGSKIMKKVA